MFIVIVVVVVVFQPIPSIYSKELQEIVNMILVKSPDDRPR
jgi:hypothetical protein